MPEGPPTLTTYLGYIAECYSSIMPDLYPVVEIVHSRKAIIRFPRCEIHMTVGRYETEFNIEFVNPQNPSETLSYIDIMRERGLLNKELFGSEIQAHIISITDTLEQLIYTTAQTSRKFLYDVIEGKRF